MIDKEKIQKLFINKDFDSVTGLVDKLLLKNKENIFLLNVKGMVHSQKEEFIDSIRYFEECLLIDNSNDKIYSNLAFAYLSIDDYDKAIENFEKAAAINNTSSQYQSQLGSLYLKQGFIPKAIISLENALTLGDKSIKTYSELSACYAQDNNEKAIASMEKVLSFDPENISNIKILSVLCIQFNDYKNSIKYLNRYLDFMPDDALVNHDLGLSYSLLNEYNLAENSFMRSIEIDPDYCLAWFNLGKMYRRQRKYDDAIEVLLWAEGLEVENVDILNELSITYYERNQKDFSLDYITKSLTFEPNNPKTLCIKARILLSEYNFSEAETFYKRAIETNEKYSEAYSGLGYLYSLTNHMDKAIIFLNKSLKINPSDGFSKDVLASIYKKDKKYNLAIDLFKEGEQPFWEENVLECLYYSERYETFNNFIKENLSAVSLSRKTSAILNHASIHLQNNMNNLYCEKPLDYIQYTDVVQIDGLPNFNKRLIEEFYTYKMDLVDRTQGLLSNGTQSTLNIFDQGSDLFDSFKEFLLNEIANYVKVYEASNDGFITNLPSEFRLNGWLVNIKKGGFLKSHNHPKGWISGVYYLKIPKKNDKKEANIKFVLHNDDFPKSDKIFPEKEIEALESRLILFPSSLYHHTNLFTDDSERICVSFDFQPSGDN